MINACKQKSPDSDARIVTRPLFSSQDLKADSNSLIFSKDQARIAMDQNNFDFFVNYPFKRPLSAKEREEEAEYFASQRARCAKEIDTFSIRAQASSIVVEYEIELESCVGQPLVVPNDSLNTFARAYYFFNCEGSDFSEFNGISIAAYKEKVRKLTPDCKTRQELILNFDMKMKGARSVASLMTPSGHPCTSVFRDGKWIAENNCLQVQKTTNIRGETVRTLERIGLVEDADEPKPWFASGKIAVNLGGWQGEVTFSNADTAPKWKLSKDGENIEGEIAMPTHELNFPNSLVVGSERFARYKRFVYLANPIFGFQF